MICRSNRPGRSKAGIEHVGAVRGGDDDDAFLRVEAVHLDEQRIERLLALVVAAAEAVAAMPADGVDFVDENQARRGFLALLEHVAHAARADADEHFHEIRAADGKERHVRLAGDGAGEQRLAGAGRADHQNAFRNASAEFLEFLRILEELDEFLHFLLRLLDAGDVLERDLVFVAREHPRLALAEVQRAFAGHPDLLAEKEIKHDEEKRDRHEPDQRRSQQIRFRLHRVIHARRGEGRLEVAVEIDIDGGAEADRLLICRGRLRALVKALQKLRRPAFLDHELERPILPNLPGVQKLLESIIRNVLDVSVWPAEKQRAPDERDGDRDEHETAPVEIRVVRIVARPVFLRRLRVGLWHKSSGSNLEAIEGWSTSDPFCSCGEKVASRGIFGYCSRPFMHRFAFPALFASAFALLAMAACNREDVRVYTVPKESPEPQSR